MPLKKSRKQSSKQARLDAALAKACYRCHVRPKRGGKRQGSALCEPCYNSD